MRINRIVTAGSWQRALGEILLIVIGITIALAVDSLWEERKARVEERDHLSQILITLSSDYEMLVDTAENAQERLKQLTDLREHIISRNPYTSEISVQLGALRRWQVTQLNTSPFEDLRASGLGLVSDHTLRRALIDFYDRNLRRIANRDQTDRTQNLREVQPYLQSRIRWSGVPIDYERLLDDNEFLYILEHRIAALEHRTVPLYSETVERAANLISALENELAGR